MFIIVCNFVIQIEKCGSNFTKPETERRYVKPTENCLKNDLKQDYVQISYSHD